MTTLQDRIRAKEEEMKKGDAIKLRDIEGLPVIITELKGIGQSQFKNERTGTYPPYAMLAVLIPDGNDMKPGTLFIESKLLFGVITDHFNDGGGQLHVSFVKEDAYPGATNQRWTVTEWAPPGEPVGKQTRLDDALTA